MLNSYKEFRYELKYKINPGELHKFYSWLSTLSMSSHKKNETFIKKQHQSNLINNIYFDNLNHDMAFDNIYGSLYKKKLRIRWYGSDSNIKNVRLEIKEKFNNLVRKNVETISTELDLSRSAVRSSSFQSLFQRSNLKFKLTYSKLFQPTLFNQYSRDYYITANEKVRITLDQRIFYSNPDKIVINSRKNSSNFDIICEVKFGKSDFDYAMSLVNSIPFKRSRYSKYSTGLNNTACRG